MTTELKSPFLQEAQARGFIFQATDLAALDEAMLKGPIKGYIGFDPTADSLHVGSMVQLMLLRLMRKHHHTPVALLGGGTARIGDPSFREEARKLMTAETIQKNLEGISKNIHQLLFSGEAHGPTPLIANNADWLDQLSYISLLQDVGVHFSISRMLSFDSVKSRLEREQGLTFLEFNYSILQSYDFRELYRTQNITLQMGGSDQWGNIVSGVELIRRTEGQQVFGLTAPLLTTSSGSKMGKTAQGAVWLSEERLPVFDYWQFWRNTEDADVTRFLKLFTELPLKECERLGSLPGAEINEAKKILATEATALCHGREKAQKALATAIEEFEKGHTGHHSSLPVKEIETSALENGLPAFKLLALTAMTTSNAEARRLIRGGGMRLNDMAVQDEEQAITLKDFVEGQLKLSLGKKRHILVRLKP
ncbi:tyrosine--tRNA ligase [Entomobacter blattae]|uniref:Tyrosine--tRNA ligase n=1 Tax=Entomobacter blattae TaxID=2762277 RepID=A0A7H1NQR9_9PROT|nr:tyrosine--tRNA ligase [Entomobacter blattae]QNT78129.1 Tyrosine--tRNA ligase [Entomobacter blattae]